VITRYYPAGLGSNAVLVDKIIEIGPEVPAAGWAKFY
jgi:hypothetical protein